MTNNDLQVETRQVLHSAQRILIASHIRPDGDAIGSLLGLGLSLKELGKDVQMVLVDGLPKSFRYLTGHELIQTEAKDPADIYISVDASDLERLGGAFQDRQPDINIDHHITNLHFGRLNLIEPESVATAAILAKHMPGWGLPITRPVSDALLVGIVTDTIGFRTSNMNPEALRLAAELMEAGANLPELYAKSLVYRSYREARYWGAGLSKLQRENSMIWTTLTLEDRKTIGYNGNDDADLNNLLSSIEDAEISVLFIEQKDHRVKVSWRARSGIDVSKIALAFGGGGHPAASGADIPGNLEEVQQRVLQETQKLLNLTQQKI